MAQDTLVPKPQQFNLTKGQPFKCKAIYFNTGGLLDGKVFSEQLTTLFQAPSKDLTQNKSATPLPQIQFSKSNTPKEGYEITVTSKGVLIKSSTAEGAFYASQTLLQLIHVKNGIIIIPACQIKDSPRFAWRGLMLDESRHFLGKASVKHLIDTMAVHKMNKFHWHLTDNEGWRIEIKSYPKLTSIGAWRGEGTKMPTPNRDQKEKGKNTPKYGGFYTQNDIKEIVAYAAARHIEIIPEIDVPGHGQAICTAYPEVLPISDGNEGKDVQGLKGNVLSVVREENYVMLDKVFGEIAALFPSQYIHVGGDEVNHGAWKNSPEHRAFMEEKGFKNVGALQNYFMLRLEKILKSHGKTLMGWNEIMHGGNLSKDTAVMAWISVGAGINAAKKGHPTIMAPGPFTYFDMAYPGPNERKGHWWAGKIDTHKAYNWNPLFENQLTPEQQKFIQGVHCCLWTEFVLDGEGMDYKLWPRACAIAEVGWTKQNLRNWDDFNVRLGRHLVQQLDPLGVQYRVKPPVGLLAKNKITIQPAYPNSITVFTLDGTEPTSKSKVYRGQSLPDTLLGKLRFRTLCKTGRMSAVAQGAKRLPVATWTKKQIQKSGTTELTASVQPDSSGLWFVELRRTKGKNNLRILKAEIKTAASTLATTKLNDTILKGRTPLKIKLPIKSRIHSGVECKLIITVEAIDGATDTQGTIIFDKSIYTEPAFTVTTSIPAYIDNKPENLANYSNASFFWSGRGVRKSDTFVITFNAPIKAKQITLPTGKAGTNSDILKSGILEYSSDGKTWEKGVPFSLGPATLKFSSPKKIKALRIKILADQTDWLVIRTPKIL